MSQNKIELDYGQINIIRQCIFFLINNNSVCLGDIKYLAMLINKGYCSGRDVR